MKRKGRLHRWMAIAMTVVLLTGQGDISVLAQEEPALSEADISDKEAGEAGDRAEQGGGEAADNAGNGSTGEDGAENGEDGGTDASGEGNDVPGGADNADAEVENGGDGDREDADSSDSGGTGQENGENTDEGNEATEGAGAEKQCVCEEACTEEAVNEACPVCMADYSVCAKNVWEGVKPSEEISEEESVSENDLAGEEESALPTAENGNKALAVGDEIWDEASHLWYRVTGDGEVEVVGEKGQIEAVNLKIPEQVEKDGVTYRVTAIKGGAFRKHLKLKSVVIPASVKNIGESAFGSSPLTSVTITEGVTNIGKAAFQGCSYLKAVTIPGTVESIGESAFDQCEDLASLTIKEGVKSIGRNAFGYCVNIKAVEIPNGVTSIGEAAFTNCSRLTSVTIPASVTAIGAIAFGGCGLTKVEIPSGVTSIKVGTFESCKKLTSATIPSSVTSIGENAFYGCESLTEVEIPEGVTKIEYATFYKCKKLTSIEIPQGVTSIGEWAFGSCTSLSHIEIPEKVTSIARGAFSSCSSLTEIEIPQGVTGIKESTFESCTSLSNVKIPEKVTSIDKWAFKDCNSLPSVTISEKVSKIGEEAFNNCNQLKTLNMVVSPDEEIQFPQVGKDAFAPFPDQDQKRYLYFYDTYDTSTDKLTGQAYEDAFAQAAKNDGDSDNSRWYGWSYEGFTAPIETYTVTVNVKKDGQAWSGHGRTFALSNSEDGSFVMDGNPAADSSYSINKVPDGVYSIYDITDVPADSLDSGAIDTEVDVTVNGADAEAEVNYYTATFYDGTKAYEEDTPQRPQSVLSGQQAEKPEDPVKADCRFAGWKTQPDGGTAYDFNKAVTETTGIYASWTEDVKPVVTYTITATAGEGGSISPSGAVAVKEGAAQRFAVTPNEGYQIKAVTADGKDATADLTENVAREQAAAKYYTFSNVREDHVIHAEFEIKDTPPDDGDDKPDDGDDKPDDGGDKPGGGDDKPGGGDDKPSGGEDKSDGEKEPDGGSSEKTGAAQTVSVTKETAPQAANTPVSGSQTQNSPAPDGKEPKTGDPTPVEIYATVAMVAGLTYLLLYFMEEGRGMTEREKEVFVAAFIRWAKKGGRFRKCCAIVAIFCLLVYYHSIGKRTGHNVFGKEYLKQAL